MGYTNDTAMSQFIAASEMQMTAGTWTPTLASNTIGQVRTAEATTFNLFVPVLIPGNSVALKGCRLKSVELLYKVATAALTSVTTVELEKMTATSAGAITGAAVTCTIDSGHTTTALRVTLADHRMTVNVTTPEWVDNDVAYWLYVTFSAPATTVLTIWGAVVNYDLRV